MKNKKNSDRYVIVSPFKVFTYILDAPALKGPYLESAVALRMKSLHPGSGHDAIHLASVDSLNRKKTLVHEGRIMAHVTAKETLEEIRESEQLPISPFGPLNAAYGRWVRKERAESAPCLGIFAHAHWVQCAVYEDGAIRKIFSWARKPGESLEDGIVAQQRLEGTESLPWFAVYLSAADIPKLQRPPLFITPLSEVLEDLHPRDYLLFPSGTNKGKAHASLIGGLVAANLGFALFIAHGSLVQKQAYLESLRSLTADTKGIEARRTELKNRLEESNRGSSKEGTAPLAGLAIIQESLKGAWIRSYTIQGDSFRIEAEGSDGVAVLSNLLAHPRIDHANLHSAVPSQVRNDIFTISGGFKK